VEGTPALAGKIAKAGKPENCSKLDTQCIIANSKL